MINCPISLSKVAWKKKENLISQSHHVTRSSTVMQDLKYLCFLATSRIYWRCGVWRVWLLWRFLCDVFKKQLPDKFPWLERIEFSKLICHLIDLGVAFLSLYSLKYEPKTEVNFEYTIWIVNLTTCETSFIGYKNMNNNLSLGNLDIENDNIINSTACSKG